MRIFQSFKQSGSLGRPDLFLGKKQQKQQNPAKDHTPNEPRVNPRNLLLSSSIENEMGKTKGDQNEIDAN